MPPMMSSSCLPALQQPDPRPLPGRVQPAAQQCHVVPVDHRSTGALVESRIPSAVDARVTPSWPSRAAHHCASASAAGRPSTSRYIDLTHAPGRCRARAKYSSDDMNLASIYPPIVHPRPICPYLNRSP